MCFLALAIPNFLYAIFSRRSNSSCVGISCHRTDFARLWAKVSKLQFCQSYYSLWA